MNEEINTGDNIEIDKLLKEFEAKSTTTPVLKQETVISSQDPELPKMVKFVIRYSGGLIKDRRYAEYVLFVFVILILSVSVLLFFSSNSIKTEVKAPLGYKVVYPANEPPRLEKIK